LDKLAKEIGISKSTTFLAVKKIRIYLKEVIENPFNDTR
jgi:predicted DNA binding protein